MFVRYLQITVAGGIRNSVVKQTVITLGRAISPGRSSRCLIRHNSISIVSFSLSLSLPFPPSRYPHRSLTPNLVSSRFFLLWMMAQDYNFNSPLNSSTIFLLYSLSPSFTPSLPTYLSLSLSSLSLSLSLPLPLPPSLPLPLFSLSLAL